MRLSSEVTARVGRQGYGKGLEKITGMLQVGFRKITVRFVLGCAMAERGEVRVMVWN